MTYKEWRKELENDKMSKMEPPLWTGSGYRALIHTDGNVGACKTFGELKTYWAENYNVTIQDTVKKLHFESVKLACAGIEAVLKEFAPAGRHLKEFDVLNAGIMTTTRFKGKINFNPEYFSDGEKSANAIAAGVEGGFYPKNMATAGAGAHEMGHIIEDWLTKKYGGSAADVQSRIFPEKWILEAYAKVIQTFQKKEFKSLKQLQKEIAEYATKNPSECLATAISDYFTNKDKAELLSRFIWQRLKEELN